MTSRSTRRSIKSEIPKIQKCKNEDDSPDKKENSGERRRSLRHSPGSSAVSLPRKSLRTKSSPNSIENKIPKTPPSSSSKSTRGATKSPCNMQIEVSYSNSDETNVTPKKLVKNSSPVLFSPTLRSTRNVTSITTNSPKSSTGIIPRPRTSPNSVGEASSSYRRATRSKIGSLSEEDGTTCESETKGDSLPKSKKVTQINSSEVKGNSQSTLTSTQGSSKKRSLPGSPDSSNSIGSIQQQSPSRSSKRKCISPESLTTNVKDTELVKNTDAALGQHRNIGVTGLQNSRMEPETTPNMISTAKEPLDAAVVTSLSNSNTLTINGKVDESGSSIETCDFKDGSDVSAVPSSAKRKLSGSSENEVLEMAEKKYKIIDNSTSKSCTEKVETNLTTIEISGIALSQLEVKDDMDISTRAEVFISDFGLTNEQCKEIANMIPVDIRDSTDVELIEVLVKKLLKEAASVTSMSAPRFNKLLRQLLVHYCMLDTTVLKKHELCESALKWSKERKSVNLRHELELALMTLYYDTNFYRKAEETATGLYNETKKLQDKEKTVRACLCLSKAYHAMGNISKARANITTAKTEALKIYTPPDLQAELDLQSGIMQVAEEKDMETAFSYFKEAATGFSERKNRSKALKYMLLTKLLVNRPEEGEKAVRSQCHVEDIDKGVEALLSITKAAVSCSLADFKKARTQYNKELEEDLVVKGVLDQLYSKMLEKNLLNIVAPYERLQISVVAEKIGLARDEVERRLSQMILDGQISAQLDHRNDCLYIYEPEGKDQVYEHSINCVSQLDRTLSLLNRRVKQLL